MAQSDPETPFVALEKERERTIELLSRYFADDNLSLEELEQRIERVYRARTVAALRELTRDLATAGAEAMQRRAARAPVVFAPEADRIVSIMSQTTRRGVWLAPRQLEAWCILSETTLDLTEAELAPGVTEIQIRALFAQIKVIVPPGVRVVMQPSAFMAEVSDEPLEQPSVGSGAPVVRITGTVVMAELKVYVRTRELLTS